ncbi:MAG: hypothetical protein U5K54_12595 [Cytophagales bacterium]|nr:hypothetical protein [Cytophagales bacterium]
MIRVCSRSSEPLWRRFRDYEVFVIGYPTATPQNQDHAIHLLPLNSFKRISLGRLLAPWQTMKLIRKVKPEVLIVNTHELLIVSALNRIIFGVKIIYDIRENYFRNVMHTSVFPALFENHLLRVGSGLKKSFSPQPFMAFLLA